MGHSFIKKILKENKIRPRKSLGQSFLVSDEVANSIVEAAEIRPKDQVLEIGAGIGILTEKIARRAERVLAVEIDPKLYSILKERIADFKNIELIKRDFLELNLEEISRDWGKKIKIVGNLPYSITKLLLRKLLDNYHMIESAVVTVQEEVARRICSSQTISPPRKIKEHGILSLWVQYFAIPEYLFRISPSTFYPSPEVWSAVVRITMRSSPAIRVENEKLLFQVVHTAFSQRRKMLRNLLKEKFQLEEKEMSQLESETRIDLARRGETLRLEEFGYLADCLYEISSRKQ